MLNQNARPIGGEYVKLVFRATRYTGCDAISFRDAVNRKMRESRFFFVINPAVTVRGTDTSFTDNVRDEFYTEALVIMTITVPSTPTFDVILNPLRNFIAGAWSCTGLTGGIRLVDANVTVFEPAPKILTASGAVSDSNAGRPPTTPSEALSTIRVIGYAVLAVAGVYVFTQTLSFIPRKRG